MPSWTAVSHLSPRLLAPTVARVTTTASLDTADVQLDPGDVIAIPVQVQNTGEIVEGYRVEVVGAPSAWAEVEPQTFSLYPGTSATATVTFHPPRSSAVPAGEQQFGVVVTPTEHPDEAVVPEGVIEVLPFLETVAELVPRTSQGRSRGKHQAAVDNRGNVPVTTKLDGRDDGNKLDVATRPPAITVNPGEARFVDVRVRPQKRIWRGAPVTHPFMVVVSAQETSSVTLDGTYVQQPTIPSWLPKLLAALLALAIALVALWFLVFKPAIESTAEEAVADDVAAAEKAADDAADSAKEVADKLPAIQQSETNVENIRKQIIQRIKNDLPAILQADPFSVRLTNGPAPAGDYVVPDNRNLAITDLVFSNPQGDFGTAQVLVAGEPMFEIALENFRDLDYHFVTPVEAPAGELVQLDVNCRAPGQPPDAPPATDCNIAMYLGGQLVELPPEEATDVAVAP